MTAALAYIDAVKAAATAMTEKKRIVCEDVMWSEIDLDGTAGRRRFVICARYYSSWPM
jgi:hypothetical protein